MATHVNPRAKIWFWMSITYIALLVLAFIGQYSFAKHHLVKIVFYAEIIYTILSLKSVDLTELGALVFFGKPLAELSPGLVPVPWGLFTLVKESALVRQDQIPAAPEDVDKTNTDVIEIPGKYFPIRATTKGVENSKDPMDKQVTVEVSALLRYRPQRNEFIQFLTNIRTMNEASRQIRDTAESEIKVQFAKRTPKEILAELQVINDALRARIEVLTTTWGIEVLDTNIVDVDLGLTVNQSLRNVPAALLKKQATITDSEGQQQSLTNIGAGTANAKKALLLAEAAGREAYLLAEAIGTAKLAEISKTDEGKIVLWLDTIRAGFEKSNHTIIPGGEFFSSIASISEILKKVGLKGGSGGSII